jgi:hypothetical protein
VRIWKVPLGQKHRFRGKAAQETKGGLIDSESDESQFIRLMPTSLCRLVHSQCVHFRTRLYACEHLDPGICPSSKRLRLGLLADELHVFE